jgi:hypothetical protein
MVLYENGDVMDDDVVDTFVWLLKRGACTCRNDIERAHYEFEVGYIWSADATIPNCNGEIVFAK